MCNKIAVYGTLRYGGPANGYMDGAKFLGTDSIPAKLFGVGWFPGIKLDPEASTVVDVYEVPKENTAKFLERIDAYEGYRKGRPDESLFNRITVLTNKSNDEVMVYEYNMAVDPDTEIQNGDWFKKDDKETT